MTTLLNDIILKNNIIEHMGSSDNPVEFFTGLTFKRLIFMVILPVIGFIFLAFILKRKYDAKKEKDEITLNGFYDVDDGWRDTLI